MLKLKWIIYWGICMEIKQARELMLTIESAYSRFLPANEELAKAKAKLWMEFLLEWDYEKTKANLKTHITTNKYEPTIADVRPTPKYKPDRKWKEELDAL